MKEIEIEKRYLVMPADLEQIKEKTISEPIIMNDYYVPNDNNHRDLRLRRKDKTYMITRKQPIIDGDTTTMLETTIPISPAEFKALTNGIETNVKKTRTPVRLFGRNGELDIFCDRHDGLVIIEFEFPNKEALAKFEREVSTGLLDITNIEWLAGGRLAEVDYKGIESKLADLQDRTL